MRFMIKAGNNINQVNVRGWSVLHYTGWNSYTNILTYELLIEFGAHPHLLDDLGQSCLTIYLHK